jgi:adenosylcobinamide-phosphate synthase
MLATVTLALVASLFELALGYPDWLYRAVGHPVGAIAAGITALESRLNRPAYADARRKLGGLVTIAMVVATSLAIGAGVAALLAPAPFGLIPMALAASTLLAHRSLESHVADVARALARSLDEGRLSVSRIVGRDPATLDEAGVARAAIESLAENFADGIVAPLFWMAVAGLPGALAYKAINTADSMIGHKSERYLQFGWAAARLDDLVNLPASRLAALWLILAALLVPGASARGAATAVWRDAGKHLSPNAGWPEAGMAGALGLKLGGARSYHGVRVEGAELGSGRAEADARDIRRALVLYRVAAAIELAALGILWLLLARP